MIFRRIATGTALAAAVLTVGAAPAVAGESSPPEIQWVNPNIIVSATDHDVATVTAKYRCFGGNNEATHLWVSVKQGPDIDLQAGHTGSEYAVSWYDTNWNNTIIEGQPAPMTTLVCDGRWQVLRQTLKNADTWLPLFGGPSELPQLQDGPALIQFCPVDSEGGASSSYSMGMVRVPSN